MKNLMVLIFFLTTSMTVFAQSKNPNDTLQIGKGSSASDKGIIFNTNDGVNNKTLKVEKTSKKLKWSGNDFLMGDTTTGNIKTFVMDSTSGAAIRWDGSFLVFSQDGVLYKKFGTGSGGGGDGGKVLAENGSFEDGVSGANSKWNESGVTASSQTYTDSIEGDEKYARVDFSAAAQYYETDSYNKPDNFPAGCSAKWEYLGGDSNIDVKVMDGSTVLASTTLSANTIWQETTPLQFPCSATMKLRFEATADAAVLDIDNVYLGSVLGITDIGVTQIAGKSYFPATTNCQWPNGTQAFNEFTADADCPPPTIIDNSVGDWQTIDANLPQQTINNLPKGKYRMNVSMMLAHNVLGGHHGIQITDGVTTSAKCIQRQASSMAGYLRCSLLVSYANSGDRTFKVLGGSTSGSMDILQSGTSDVAGELTFDLTRYPLEGQKAFLPETQNFRYEGKIFGPNFTMGAGSNLIPNGPTLTLENVIGTAKIGCLGAISEASTCSGSNEQLSVQVDLPSAGDYEVCFNHFMSNGSTGVERISRLDPDSDTITSTGIKQSGVQIATITTDLCDVVAIPNAGEHKFAPTLGATGTTTYLVERAANTNNRDIGISITKVSQNVPTLILVGGGVYVPGANQKRLKKYTVIFGGAGNNEICTSSPCTIFLERGGDWINGNVTRASLGVYHFVSDSVFKPNEVLECYCLANQSTATAVNCAIVGVGTTNSAFKANGAGILDFSVAKLEGVNAGGSGLVDANISFTCYGEE